MNKYHKIQSVFKRDPATKHKTFLDEYSVPEFEYLKNNNWIWTEKVNGTNIRLIYNEGKTSIGGKSEETQTPAFLYEKLQSIIPSAESFENVFESIECPVCLYGEGYGAKIQKGGGNYIRGGISFALFDIKIGNVWLKRKSVEDIASKFKLLTVPTIGSGTLEEAIKKTKEGFNSNWGEFLAEGMVLRPEVELIDRMGRRIITKLKHKDFKKETNEKERQVD